MLLDENAKKIFSQLPIYTPALMALTEPPLAALVIRVDKLDSFDQRGLSLQVAFAGYEHEGNYLACLAFRVFDNPTKPLEGDAYLNPRQQSDRKALGYLATQQHFPFVFLSANLKREVGKSISWQQKSRDAAREVYDRSASAGILADSFDREFQRCKDKFQSIYTVKDLLRE